MATVLAAVLGGPSVRAGRVEHRNPYWFRDGYTATGSIDLAATTAMVETANSGTVSLPYAPLQAAFEPGGPYALVATESGVFAYVSAGRGVLPVPGWGLGALAATGVAWLAGGAAFAVATPAQLLVYGIDPGGRAVLAARAPTSGVTGLAAGPATLPSAILAATERGAQLYIAHGDALVPRAGGPGGLAGNLGVATVDGGTLAATWQRDQVQLWVWDGAAYLPAPLWDPPAPAVGDGTIVGVAFFPQGGGYWVLTGAGVLSAYAFGAAGLSELAAWSRAVPAAPQAPAALAAGWGTAAAAVLYPGGWTYDDLSAAGAFGQDGPRSLSGQTWPVYVPTAVLQSVVLPVGRPVAELRVEDADCAAGSRPPGCAQSAVVPPGTALAYAVGTDGCRHWMAVPTFANVMVPPGADLCYRLTLTTTDPRETPVVDVTNVYEIAQQRTSGSVAALLCTGGGC